MARQSLRVRGVLRRRAAYAQEDARVAARHALRISLILIGIAFIGTTLWVILSAPPIILIAMLGALSLVGIALWARYLVLRARAQAAALRWHRGDDLTP